jgi:hypothetical protein
VDCPAIDDPKDAVRSFIERVRERAEGVSGMPFTALGVAFEEIAKEHE